MVAVERHAHGARRGVGVAGRERVEPVRAAGHQQRGAVGRDVPHAGVQRRARARERVGAETLPGRRTRAGSPAARRAPCSRSSAGPASAPTACSRPTGGRARPGRPRSRRSPGRRGRRCRWTGRARRRARRRRAARPTPGPRAWWRSGAAAPSSFAVPHRVGCEDTVVCCSCAPERFERRNCHAWSLSRCHCAGRFCARLWPMSATATSTGQRGFIALRWSNIRNDSIASKRSSVQPEIEKTAVCGSPAWAAHCSSW